MSVNKLIKSQKTRILHIITGIDTGGAENHLLSLIKGLNKNRYDVTVAYLKGNGELKEEFEKIGISLIYISMRFNYNITALWKLYRLIRKNKYDIVHTHLFHADIYGVLTAFLARTPVVISSEHNEEQFLKKRIYSFLHCWASLPCKKLIAISENVKKYMLATGIKNADKIEVVYYGLDWSRYDNLEFNIDEKEILIGTVARLAEQKGLSYLLEAFAKVLENEPKCKLIIIGQGELKKELKDLSKKLGIENKVTFTGFRKDIPEIMSSIDIFVLPSLWEGFGLVLLEAMAAKRPIVATKIGAIPEIVIDGKTGILVPSANAEALANGILRLIKQRNLAKTMGEAGRERLEVHFGIEKMVKKTERIYDGLIRNKLQVKVLHIITLSEWGGAQQVCYDIVTNLNKEKYHVEVACAPGGELVNHLRERGIVVHTIASLKRNISPTNDLKALLTLYRLIRKERYDIVHCHSTKAGLAGRIAAWLARTPRIYFTAHGWGFYNVEEYGYMHRLLVLFEKLASRVSTKVICVSTKVKEDGLKRGIATDGKFTVVRNGTRWDQSSYGRGGLLRKEIKADDSNVLFGMVARLTYPKNPLLFLETADRVLKRHIQAKFILIGDGPIYGNCEEFVREKGLEENIFLLGFREDVRRLLQNLDVFVLCSQFEGLPMTIIEAMFAGLPIIATNVGGIGELVQEERNGFLTQSGSAEELAERIIYLIENSERCIEMGKESRRIADEGFTIDKVVQEYEELYMEKRKGTDLGLK